MGESQTIIEVVDPETGEAFNLNATSLVSNVRDVFLSRRRMQTQATEWSKLSEADQREEINAMHELARSTINKVVEVVAEAGQTCAHVEVSKFAVDVDKGEVVITSKGFASDEMLTDLAHAKGKVAKLTVVDAQQFNKEGKMPEPEPDQPDMLPEGDDDPGEKISATEANKALQESIMSADDISATAEEMDAQLDDADDLHADEPDTEPEAPAKDPEPEAETTEPEAETFDPTPFQAEGAAAAFDEKKASDNPHDDGSDESNAWLDGYSNGLEQVDELHRSGYDARADGMAPTRCTWKKGTPEHKIWMLGYTERKNEEKD